MSEERTAYLQIKPHIHANLDISINALSYQHVYVNLCV